MQLYGFADPEERRMFETLLTVQGWGPRWGLPSCLVCPSAISSAPSRG